MPTSRPDQRKRKASRPKVDYGREREDPFERDIPQDFREQWPTRTQIHDLNLRACARPGRRTHWDEWGPTGLQYHGPVFDRCKMVDGIIDRMDAGGAVGFAWAIVQNGRLVDAGGLGYARTPAEVSSREMESETRMVSASLAKPVCAVAIMKLVEDGQLHLDEFAYPKIESQFPDVHPSVNTIRVRHLLTHQSGFDGPGKLSQFENALQQELTNEPGTITRYENWNYWFLAYIVEGVTGQPYVDVATENILTPMTIENMNREVDDINPCLYYGAGSVTNGDTWGDFGATAIGAYGWFASVIDWAKFLTFFRYDRVLSKASRLEMLNAPTRFFGFQHRHGQERGSYYGHGGDFSGKGTFQGDMMGFPDGIDAVLLTNSGDVPSTAQVLIDAYHDAYV